MPSMLNECGVDCGRLEKREQPPPLYHNLSKGRCWRACACVHSSVCACVCVRMVAWSDCTGGEDDVQPHLALTRMHHLPPLTPQQSRPLYSCPDTHARHALAALETLGLELPSTSFALQHSQDWLEGASAVVATAVAEAEANCSAQHGGNGRLAVVGIGVDFTSCTFFLAGACNQDNPALRIHQRTNTLLHQYTNSTPIVHH